MKVAITGGYGLVGTHLAALLRARGDTALQLSRRDGVDINDEPALREAFEGCDAVAHCAGINREIGGQTYNRVHIQGTRKVVAVARAAGVRHISLVSFLRARPGTGWAYHESKWQAEQIVRSGGIPFTILKAGVIYGRGDHMLDHLKRALLTFPVFGFVGFRRGGVAPAHVNDVARILLAAMDRPALHDRTFAVIGPDSMSLQAAVKLVASVVERKPLFVRLPVWTHMAIAWAAERMMKEPMASIAQVRILSEGVVEALPQADSLPSDLKPTIRFDETSVRDGLPNAGRYGFSDLRCRLCTAPGTA